MAVADHLRADGTYFDIPENIKRSHDELIVSLRDFFATYRHRYELFGEILTGQNTVAFQYQMRPANNKTSEALIDGAEFITLRGDTAAAITDGKWMTRLSTGKIFCYIVLLGLGAYWAVLSHWLHTWDTLLWIGGFVAIDANLHDWRDEIRAKNPITNMSQT